MKIIYVENVRIPSERAHAYQIVQTCAWFARLGHEVILVNPDRSKWQDVLRFYGLEPQLFKHVKLPVTDPLSVKWMPRKIAYFFQRFFFAQALKKWAKNQTADIWYTRDPAMVDILISTGRKIVLELHDRPDAQPARWERVRHYITKYIVISEGLKVLLESLGIKSEDIHVAPDGFDPKEMNGFQPKFEARRMISDKIPEDAFVAIYLGAFFSWKGIDLIVKAWSKTPSNAYLVLIGGPDEDRERLRRFWSFADAKTQERITILQTMPRGGALPLLAAADVGLLTTSPEFEIGRSFTSPLKQFEYLAAGLPIIASDVPSSHEVLDDRVAKFYAYTEEGFVSALREAMDDTAWRKNASRIGQEIVKPYTWEARARGIMQHLV